MGLFVKRCQVCKRKRASRMSPMFAGWICAECKRDRELDDKK